jgi:hypothetical protein
MRFQDRADPKENPMNWVAVLPSVILVALVIGSVGFTGLVAAETVEFTVSSSYAVRFERNHVVFYARSGGGGGGRGFTVAAIDPTSETGQVIDVRTFDTWGGGCPAHDELVAFLDGFPIGTLLLVAVGDEAGLRANDCSDRTRRALEILGSTQIRSYGFRNAWALIAVKGEGRAVAETLGGQGQLRVVEARLAFPLASPIPSTPRALWCGNAETAPQFDPIEVTIEDSSGNHLTAVRVLRPTTVCFPYGLNTSTEPPVTVDSWIVCYDLAGIELKPHVTVRVQTALGTHTLKLDSVNTVCIPARPVN